MQCIKGDFLSRKVLLTTKYTKDDTRGTRKGKEKGQNQKGRNSECLMKRNGEGAFSCLTLNPSPQGEGGIWLPRCMEKLLHLCIEY